MSSEGEFVGVVGKCGVVLAGDILWVDAQGVIGEGVGVGALVDGLLRECDGRRVRLAVEHERGHGSGARREQEGRREHGGDYPPHGVGVVLRLGRCVDCGCG